MTEDDDRRQIRHVSINLGQTAAEMWEQATEWRAAWFGRPDVTCLWDGEWLYVLSYDTETLDQVVDAIAEKARDEGSRVEWVSREG